MQIVAIATLCHELNRAYCTTLGDTSQVPWAEAPDWQKESAIAGVEHALAGTRTPRESHESWLRQKEADGWKYGPVKDAEKKEHPCFVPYDELPDDQKLKDTLFLSVVDAISGKTAQRRARITELEARDAEQANMANGDARTSRGPDIARPVGLNPPPGKQREQLRNGSWDVSRMGVEGDELDKFLRRVPRPVMTVAIHPPENRIALRIASRDQTDVIDGFVEGNEFIPTEPK